LKPLCNSAFWYALAEIAEQFPVAGIQFAYVPVRATDGMWRWARSARLP
jgi:hypothetical protein